MAIIAHIMRQQRLSPYDATLAARYQHSALHVSPSPSQHSHGLLCTNTHQPQGLLAVCKQRSALPVSSHLKAQSGFPLHEALSAKPATTCQKTVHQGSSTIHQPWQVAGQRRIARR